VQHASIFDLRIARLFGFILKYSCKKWSQRRSVEFISCFMLDQRRLIEKKDYTKPRATFLSCSLLSHARLTIGLDHVRMPGGMVTDNSQLVLRADRMLFSRKVPPLTTAVCPDYYTPPHDKQAALLTGTKVAPFHPPYLPTVSAKPNGPNWWNGPNGSPAQRTSATPL
jgi:hypothetical protein